MPRTYVDNASNRSLGRVGMTVGSAVVSSGGGRSSSGSGGYSGGGGGSTSFNSYGSSSSSASSSRTYVDNSVNRSLGRVGLEVGSAVHSKSSSGTGEGGYSSSSSSSNRVYVDNSMNRSLGRVGLEVGSAVHSSSSGTGGEGHSSSNRTYVDNSSNRSLGRVGLDIGSAVHSTSSASKSKSKLEPLPCVKYGSSTSVVQDTSRCYVDNAYNRRLGRVGLPLGSSVNRSTSTSLQNKSTIPKSNEFSGPERAERRYVDNPMNRRFGRVGKVVGTAPVPSTNSLKSGFPECIPRSQRDEIYHPLTRIDPEDHNLQQVLNKIIELQQEKIEDLERNYKCDKAKGIVHRHEASLTKYKEGLQKPDFLEHGEIIDFSDLEIGEKLGGGGFGDVFVAIWQQKCQVAVKKLRVQRVSQAKKEQFYKEVLLFSSLSHPAIVEFYGVCNIPPNLAIVMEFMGKGSLHDVLHVEQWTLTLKQKKQMISDILSAVAYLHDEKELTHRDIKCMNILVCDDFENCKLGDFGLALKEESRSSSSVADFCAVGTCRYSPPEVLDGDRLSFENLKKVDIYSMTVVFVEVLTQKEPFDGLNQHQIRRAVLQGDRPSMCGESGSSVEIPMELKSLLTQGFAQRASDRPSASRYFEMFKKIQF